MKTRTLASLYASAAVTLLVILTAWGNALAMLVVSIVGLVVGLLVFGKSIRQRRAMAALLAACAVAVVVAAMVAYRLS
jgi:hypothetical protein